jgi:anthranilate phosphoribosyltransferase
LQACRPGSIDGGDAHQNAGILTRVLGGGDHPSRDAFVLNAAAALVVAEELSLREAAQRADEAIRSGRAQRTLERWRTASLEPRTAVSE